VAEALEKLVAHANPLPRRLQEGLKLLVEVLVGVVFRGRHFLR